VSGNGATPQLRSGITRAILPAFVVALSGVAWGAFYVLAKLATTAGAHPMGLALWEGLVAGLMLCGVYLARQGRLPPGVRNLRFYAINGLLGLTVPAVAFFAVARHLPVGVTTLLFTLVPIMTYALALLIGVERFAWYRVAGVFAGFTGVLLILLPEASLPEPQMAPWVLTGFAAASLYAAQNVYIARSTPPGTDSLATACGTLLVGGALLLPAVALTGGFFLPSWPMDRATWCALGIAALSGAATLMLFWLIRRAGALYASQVAYSTMFGGVLWGFILFDERLGPWVWAAVLLMCLGVALVDAAPRKRAPR
jgi:drug/metabolite transporter (DMT)-like permease